MASGQGHVKTTSSDGKDLMILFLLDKPEDIEAVKKDLHNQVEVLRSFATAWNKGDKDVNGKQPLSESQPCDYLIVIKQQHLSTISPSERIHITVKPASQGLWGKDPREAKGVIHVYSKDNITANGYDGYFLQATKSTKYGSDAWRDAIKAAMANDYEKGM